MAHPDSPEAVDAPVTDMDSAAAAISNLNLDGDEPEEEDESELPDDEPEGDAPEGEDEGEQDDEPETAIEAPASLTAEEKAKFAQLPTEAQQLLNEVETRRNAQVQQATTKASDAQRQAEARAASADAEARKAYSEQLKTVFKAIAPEPPSPDLARTDPAEYIAQKAQYDASIAQLGAVWQQAEALGQEADGQIDQAFIAERDRALSALPEIQNEATRHEFFEKAIGAASALGLDTPALNRATADEWQKLRQIHDWKTKADKYDAATARNMQRVRDAKKAKPNKPAATQGNGAGRAFREATTRLRETGDLRDAAAAIAKLG